jgi:hypothetical protein
MDDETLYAHWKNLSDIDIEVTVTGEDQILTINKYFDNEYSVNR